MLEKDSVLFGLLLGLCIPFVGFATFKMLVERIQEMTFLGPEAQTFYIRERTLAIFAICLNLLPFNFYKKRRFESAMRGIVMATLIYVFVWVFYFANLMF